MEHKLAIGTEQTGFVMTDFPAYIPEQQAIHISSYHSLST